MEAAGESAAAAPGSEAEPAAALVVAEVVVAEVEEEAVGVGLSPAVEVLDRLSCRFSPRIWCGSSHYSITEACARHRGSRVTRGSIPRLCGRMFTSLRALPHVTTAAGHPESMAVSWGTKSNRWNARARLMREMCILIQACSSKSSC